jgi:hypothetical protein
VNTSYFFSNKLNKEQKLISISASIPKNIKNILLPNIIVYKPLCPTWKIIQDYKRQIISKEEYTRIYIGYFLNNLDAAKVYQELGNDAILLCWERPNKFCHRHIVAEWLSNSLNIQITEL